MVTLCKYDTGEYYLEISDKKLGIHREEPTGTKSRGEALQWKKKAEEMLQEAHGKPATPVKASTCPTLKQYVYGWPAPGGGQHLGWIHNTAEKGLKRTTRLSYERLLKKHLVPRFGKTPIDQITTAGLYELVGDLFDRGLKSRTIRNVKNCLGSVLRQAKKEGRIPINPAREVEIPTPEAEADHIPNPFTRKERDHFEAVFKEIRPRYYPFIVCGFRTGMRIGELIGLKWKYIDLQGRRIHIAESNAWGVQTTPKSRRGRVVRMTEHLIDVLQAHQEALKEDGKEFGWIETPEWAFPNQAGKAINQGNFYGRIWHPVIAAAGIDPDKKPHDMRHTYATHRLSLGHPIAEVSKELGHSDPDITYRVYYQWIPDMSRSDIGELD